MGAPSRRQAATLVSGLALGLASLIGGGPSSAADGVALTVDATAGRHPISPLIYGVNFAAKSGVGNAYPVPVDRWGGNSTSRYNYLNNTSNTGSDWYYENIVATGADTLGAFIAGDRARRTASLVTVPMLGYVSKTSPTEHPFLCSYPVTVFGEQDGTDPWDPDCGTGTRNGGATALTASPTRTSVAVGPAYVAAMVRSLVARFGSATHGGVRFYALDNEPTLWNSTHRDVHPQPLTYDELRFRSVPTAAAIKRADPGAAVVGPSDWGWCAYYYSTVEDCGANRSDHRSHANMDLAPWYLAQFRSASATVGHRLLDYFDEHYYPQADGVALAGAGSPATQALRLRSTRSLWDPTYRDESWIGRDVGAPPIQLIPTMKRWVAANYPGTRTAITEYNFGGLEAVNGALAQADVLGIFGRQGLDLATLWDGPSADQPGSFAFRMYLNYDGRGARFGDTSVRAASTDQGRLAIYAAQRGGDAAMTLMVINKSSADIGAPLALAHFRAGGPARVFRYSAAAPRRIVAAGSTPAPGGRITTRYPANSITLLVVPRAP